MLFLLLLLLPLLCTLMLLLVHCLTRTRTQSLIARYMLCWSVLCSALLVFLQPLFCSQCSAVHWFSSKLRIHEPRVRRASKRASEETSAWVMISNKRDSCRTAQTHSHTNTNKVNVSSKESVNVVMRAYTPTHRHKTLAFRRLFRSSTHSRIHTCIDSNIKAFKCAWWSHTSESIQSIACVRALS